MTLPKDFSVRQGKTLEAEALSRAIGVWLRSLPAEKRTLFLRRYWFSEPTEEIAKALFMPTITLSESK